MMADPLPRHQLSITKVLLHKRKNKTIDLIFLLHRYIFWTEWDEGENYTKSSIARANMDGTDMKRILYKDIYWPNALTVDYVIQRIFFADAKDGIIWSTTFSRLISWHF